MIAWGRAALLGVLLGASACSDDGDEASSPIPCNIAQESCRRAIFSLTSRLRQQPHSRLPPARIITRQQYADETRAELAMQMSSPQGMQYEVALRLLDFLPEGSSTGAAEAESNINGVAAYYASDTKAVTIISDVAEQESSGSLTLSHEYTHALQDQREGLVKLSENARSTDEIMAVNALVEGEATILADAAMAEARGLDYDYPRVSSYLDRLLDALLMDIEASPAPFNEGQLVLPYPVGGRPLAQGYAATGYAGIAPFFARQRPETLAGWVDTTRTGLPGTLRCSFPNPPTGYMRIGLDQFGATGLIALEVVAGASGTSAYQYARAWTNDAIAVFAPMDQSAQAALTWRIALTDASAASALAARLRAANLSLSLDQQGAELVLSAASQPDVFAAWTARNECSTDKSSVQPQALLPHLPRWFQHLTRGAR
jgi:hypothetical protein